MIPETQRNQVERFQSWAAQQLIQPERGIAWLSSLFLAMWLEYFRPRPVNSGVRLLRVMRAHKFWVPFVCSLVVTPIFLFVGAVTTGAGHGSYSWVKALFPYTMLSAAVFDVIYFPFAFLALFQFPAYGLALGYANEKGKVARMAVILLAAHCVAAAVALLLTSESFP